MRLFGYILILGLIIGINPAMAKERDHIVQGYVIDNFMGENLPNITLTLMTADSTVIAIDKTIDSPEYPQLSGHYSFKIRKTGRYIIKATSIGYEDGYMNFELRSNREVIVMRVCLFWHTLNLLKSLVLKLLYIFEWNMAFSEKIGTFPGVYLD